MKYRKLGKSSISVFEIGFGTWGIGGSYKNSIGYGPTEDEETLKALLYAQDHGVNFYDTAPLYGLGHSEKMLGKAFQHCREKVVISTKVGIKDFSGGLDFSPQNIVDSLNQSLKRLRTDYVDALLLHSPPIEILKSGHAITQLELLQRAGKVRLIGISGKTPSDCLEAISLYQFDLIREFVLSDTTGKATVENVQYLMDILFTEFDPSDFALHFHDTFGQAEDNLKCGLDNGITTFDASTGGIGGCPFSPGAKGNIATHKAVSIINDLGFSTGINKAKLDDAGKFINLALSNIQIS